MNRLSNRVALGLAGLMLAACQHNPLRLPALITARPAPPPEAAPPQSALPGNLDDYKVLVAGQILAANPDIIFSGQLPPMLPAIVVVDLSVDQEGALTRAEVHRSRDADASNVALAALRRVERPFPKPRHLLPRGASTLDFSETFLFNDNYHFQLRTLAGPQ